TRYGTDAQRVLKKEPYRVAREIEGIGFKTADRIAINLGFANDSPPRLDAGIIYALETLAEDGHTAIPEGDLEPYAADLLQADSDRIRTRIIALVKEKSLVPDGTPDDPIVQLPVLALAEAKIAASLLRLTRNRSGLPAIKIDAAVAWAQERAHIEFSQLQTEGLKRALSSKISILTGGPGTGKTTCLRALVEILRAKKCRVHLAAPTGRAAQRLKETTGGFAQTIHRLLKIDPANGGFTVNEEHPLPTDFLIVDEASMLDTRLAASLVQAVPPRAHLLLVGDTDQLPSVGAGNVLKDLIASGIAPVTRLSVIYRQEKQSLIVTTAHAVNQGNGRLPPAFDNVANLAPHLDLQFVMANSPEDCVAKVVEICTKFLPAKARHFDPVGDVQVLAPMHKGVAGVQNLNRELQAALNPRKGGMRTMAGELRPGDKLIQLRNNYDKGLFNGDIGMVVSVNPEAGSLVAEFDGMRHPFERGDLGDVALAFAISIHKCVAADTWILTTAGWRQISELWPDQGSGTRVRQLRLRVAGLDGVVTTDQIYQGRKEKALRLTTRHGYELAGSLRHPVQVFDPGSGRLIWKKLPGLKPGDFLPIRRGMELFPRKEFAVRYVPVTHPRRRIISLPGTVNPDISLLLGYLVGDGSYDERKDGDIRLTNADRSLVRNFARILREQFGVRPTLSRSTAHKTAPTWYVISRTLREWLIAAGLDHATARTKKVPFSILQSPRPVQAAFLRGLFDTDGSASGNGTRVVLATSSARLAEQVRMMLLNFGIITALLNIKASDSWRVEIYGANLRLFERHIGFGLAAKARQLRRMARRGEIRNGKTNVDIIPGADSLWRELRGEIQKRLGPTKGRAGKGLFAHDFLPSGILMGRLAQPACQTNYRHLAEMLSALAQRWHWVKTIPVFAKLAAQLQRNFFFDPIRRVEFTEAKMFDLHVPRTHAFMTNGFISHNSQGSEYPVVIIPLLKAHFMMLQRNLLYTGITRGRKRVFIVGEPAAWGMAVRNAESKQRRTHLREKIAAGLER
ncbi:MAG TPA: AAA family ATPase, partial [Opitutaceae bacterium]